MTTPRVLGLAPGDPTSSSTWSGTAVSLFGEFDRRGQLAGAIDVSLPRALDLCARAVTVTPDVRLWRERSSLGRVRAVAGRLVAQHRLRSAASSDADLLLQIGSWARPPNWSAGPRAIYLDSAFAQLLARRDGSIRAASSFARWRSAFERRVYTEADLVFTFSEWTRASIVEDFGVPAGKVVVARPGPNGPLDPTSAELRLDARSGRAESPGPRILFVGKKWQRKGGPTLVAAFTGLRKTFPYAQLWIVGPTEPLPRVDGVRAWGRLDRSVAADAKLFEQLMGLADFFAMPSRYEPFGMVFLEAMHRGLACVGTQQCAMPEIILDGETGRLVPEDDVDALTEVLLAMAEDPEATLAMGQAARVRAAEHFTWARCVADMNSAVARL